MALPDNRTDPRSVLLSARGLRISLGEGASETEVLDGVDLDVRSGEFVSLVGASGCGKTTLLLVLAGLLVSDDGVVEVAGREVREPPPEISVVFQDYSSSLFPWLSARKNVLAGMRRRSDLTTQEKQALAEQLLERVGIGPFADRYPWELSGGMQQRLALARAVASGSSIVCLDEPFASVDAYTRLELQDFVTEILQEFGRTGVLVTHDIEEAVYMADRVLALGPRPTRVVWEEDVSLPRPRSQIETREEPLFLELRHKILSLLKDISN